MGMCIESLQKNSLKPNAASHDNASWYTDTDGFSEYSPSQGNLYYKGPILQKIILGFLGPLIVHHVLSTEQGISDTKLGMWSLPSTFSHCLTWEPQSLDTDTSAPQTQVKGGKHRAFNES